MIHGSPCLMLQVSDKAFPRPCEISSQEPGAGILKNK